MFHPIGGLTQQEKISNNTREFMGNGTPYLKVPGLGRVTAVRLGNLDLPLEIGVEHPTDASLARVETVRMPLVALMDGEDGERVLLRSMLSNDGIWQDGARIYVTGEWAAAETPEPAVSGRRRG